MKNGNMHTHTHPQKPIYLLKVKTSFICHLTWIVCNKSVFFASRNSRGAPAAAIAFVVVTFTFTTSHSPLDELSLLCLLLNVVAAVIKKKLQSHTPML